VLPVFFRQTDACLVDRQGFDTMCELNPQLGKQLRTLASSPRLITMVFCFRSAYSPPVKNEIVRAMEELYTTPAGQQILTVFQIDKMQIASDSDLDSARELLDAYEQLAAVSRRPADDSKKPPSDGSQRQEQVSSAETARENH
jgi:phosphonate transport system substrate-binding protein